jgi:hypothetical protein
MIYNVQVKHKELVNNVEEAIDMSERTRSLTSGKIATLSCSLADGLMDLSCCSLFRLDEHSPLRVKVLKKLPVYLSQYAKPALRRSWLVTTRITSDRVLLLRFFPARCRVHC